MRKVPAPGNGDIKTAIGAGIQVRNKYRQICCDGRYWPPHNIWNGIFKQSITCERR